MRGLDRQGVQQSGGVVGHVAQRIGDVDRIALHLPREHRQHIGDPMLGELGRQPDVAIVEPDDPVTARRELRAKLLVPGDHLRGEPHDQHQRRGIAVAERVVAKLDAVRLRQGGLAATHARHIASTFLLWPVRRGPSRRSRASCGLTSSSNTRCARRIPPPRRPDASPRTFPGATVARGSDAPTASSRRLSLDNREMFCNTCTLQGGSPWRFGS